MRPREKFNTKRKLDAAPSGKKARDMLATLAQRVSYTGNPEHKRNPGDFGLTPPAAARPGKTLCDDVEIFRKRIAQKLLRQGVRRGLVSLQKDTAGFPQNVWAVTPKGVPLEAQLENPTKGQYHGYPMPANDPFRPAVLEAWKTRAP